MHERGACGCEAQFPLLQHPRHVVDTPGENAERYKAKKRDTCTTTPTSGSGDGSGDSNGRSCPDTSNGSTAKNRRRNRRKVAREVTPPAGQAEHESLQPNRHQIGHLQIDSPRSVEIAEIACDVRISSQYGAEWNRDHAPSHAEGKCLCRIRFEPYQPSELLKQSGGDDQDDPFIDTLVKVGPFPDTMPALRRSDIATWKLQEATNNLIFCPFSPQDYGFKNAAVAEFHLDLMEGRHSANQSRNFSPVSDEGQDISFETSHESYPSHAAVPPPTPPSEESQQPRIWSTDITDDLPLPPVDAALNAQSHQMKELPIAGWPLGAGPEGYLENSHAGPWEECRLYQCLPRPHYNRASHK